MQINPYALNQDETELVSTILYECHCALFLVDITSQESFEGVKNVIKVIDNAKNPYLTKIVVCNKSDLEENRAVSKLEFKEYTDRDPTLQSIELTLKGEESQFQILLHKIYDAVYPQMLIPSNVISDSETSSPSKRRVYLLILGESEVGKTSLIKRYCKYTFEEKCQKSIGIEYEYTYKSINNELYKVIALDTAGEKRFRVLTNETYQKANCILLLFDVTNDLSFANIKYWMKDIKLNIHKRTKSDLSNTVYLIGNKVDMIEKRVVSREKAETEASEYGIKYYEISCKLNLNVSEVMNNIVLACNKRVKEEESNVFQQKEKREKQTWWRIKK